MAYNEATGEIGEYPVTATISHTYEEVVVLILDSEVLITTPDHPFYTSDSEWVDAGDLQLGDTVVQLDGDEGVVVAVRIIHAPQPMFNLTVDEAHTFFVGEQDWLVHNIDENCFPKLTTGNPRDMLHQADNSVLDIDPDKRIAAYDDFFDQISDASGRSWKANRQQFADGSVMWWGDRGPARVVNANGEVYVGNVLQTQGFPDVTKPQFRLENGITVPIYENLTPLKPK